MFACYQKSQKIFCDRFDTRTSRAFASVRPAIPPPAMITFREVVMTWRKIKSYRSTIEGILQTERRSGTRNGRENAIEYMNRSHEVRLHPSEMLTSDLTFTANDRTRLRL